MLLKIKSSSEWIKESNSIKKKKPLEGDIIEDLKS